MKAILLSVLLLGCPRLARIEPPEADVGGVDAAVGDASALVDTPRDAHTERDAPQRDTPERDAPIEAPPCSAEGCPRRRVCVESGVRALGARCLVLLSADAPSFDCTSARVIDADGTHALRPLVPRPSGCTALPGDIAANRYPHPGMDGRCAGGLVPSECAASAVGTVCTPRCDARDNDPLVVRAQCGSTVFSCTGDVCRPTTCGP